MSHRLILLCGLMTFISLLGCSNDSKPDNLIPENKYINMYVDFQLLRGFKHLYTDTSKAGEIRQRVLDKYGVTMEQFRKSDNYYESQPGQKQRLRDALSRMSTVKDSVWNAYNPASKNLGETNQQQNKADTGSTHSDSKH